jgi:hypothetical protein
LDPLVVVDHFPVGVSYRGPYLQTLKLIGCRRSGTMRRGVIGEDFSWRVLGLHLLASYLG